VTDPARSGAPAPIVVAINAARRCGETLELAAALAAKVGAELEVVFVEDVNLLRLADLPVTREVDRLSGMAREMDSGRMLRALHCEVQQLRREISRLGKTTSVRSTVRVVRGHYLTEALMASARVEVTFVHGARRALSGEHLGGAPARWVTAGPVAAASRRMRGKKVLWVLFDGSPAGARALKVALMLAGTLAGDVVVLVPGGSAAEIEVRKQQAKMTTDRDDLQFLAVERTVMRTVHTIRRIGFPLHLQRFQAFQCPPGIVGEHRDRIIELDNALEPTAARQRRCIYRF